VLKGLREGDFLDLTSIERWLTALIETQRIPGLSPAWEQEVYSTFVPTPTDNWELVAWHKGNMDAANGIFGLWLLGGGSNLITSHRIGASSILALILLGRVVPTDAERVA